MLLFNMDIIYSLSLWTFIIRLAFVACSATEAQSGVIGSSGPITAAPGDAVILPCHVEPQLNVQGLTVEWSRPDLKPDPSDPLGQVQYVHIYRGRNEFVDMKIPSYIRRTELFVDELKHGNISLRIINVTLADSGRYRCFIPKLRSNMKHSVVELVVVPNLVKTTTTEMPLHPRTRNTPDSDDMTDVKGHPSLSIWIPCIVFGILAIAGGGVCAYFYKKHFQNKDVQKEEAAPSKELLA